MTSEITFDKVERILTFTVFHDTTRQILDQTTCLILQQETALRAYSPLTRQFFAPKGNDMLFPRGTLTFRNPLTPPKDGFSSAVYTATFGYPRLFKYGPFNNRPKRLKPTAQRCQRLARRATRHNRK